MEDNASHEESFSTSMLSDETTTTREEEEQRASTSLSVLFGSPDTVSTTDSTVSFVSFLEPESIEEGLTALRRNSLLSELRGSRPSSLRTLRTRMSSSSSTRPSASSTLTSRRRAFSSSRPSTTSTTSTTTEVMNGERSPSSFTSTPSSILPGLFLEDRSSPEFRGQRFRDLSPMDREWYDSFRESISSLVCPICREVETDRVLVCIFGHSVCRSCFEKQQTQSHILEKICCLCRKPWIHAQGISLREWKPLWDRCLLPLTKGQPWKVHDGVDVQLPSRQQQWFPAEVIHIDVEQECMTLRVGQKWNVLKNVFSDEIQPLYQHSTSFAGYIESLQQEWDSSATFLWYDREHHVCFDYYVLSLSQWVLAKAFFVDTLHQTWFFLYFDPQRQQYESTRTTIQEMMHSGWYYFPYTFSRMEECL